MTSTNDRRARPGRRFAGLCGVTALIAAASCGSKPLQKLDASGGGIGAIDAGGGGLGDGGVADGGGAVTDGGGGTNDRPPWDVPFAGRRSFNMTAQVFADGGAAPVTSHDFTMTLDMDERSATIGVTGGAEVWNVEETAPGTLRLEGPINFGVPVAAACGGSVQYTDLTFMIDPSGGLWGNGRGALTTYEGDVGRMVPATVALTGVPDNEPPTLSVSAGGDLADPWTPVWVVSSEPLRDQLTRPVLRSTGGDVLEFWAPSTLHQTVTVMSKPDRLLRFGEEYRITFTGVIDLAGNAPRPFAPAPFTTRPPPPLVVDDGFESITDATFGGVQVLSGAGAPTITGERSLYIPPVTSLAPSGRLTQLVLRLPVGPNHKTVGFDYRTVNPGEGGPIQWMVAGIGGTIEGASLNSDVGAPQTTATIDSIQVMLGPKKSASIPIPFDAQSEVVIIRIASQGARCGGPPPLPVPGIIIDNLRTQ